jgi:hypothetical protein
MATYEAIPFNGQRPSLRVSTRVRRPVLVGLIRPTILIPLDLNAPEASEPLRLSLLHELAHASRGDPWFGLASSLAQVVWFFLPPLWWIRAQMRLDQEFMADRLAAGSFGPLRSYASSLVNIARPAEPARSTVGPAVAVNPQLGGSPLFLRILMLVQCPFVVEARPPRWWSWVLPGVLLGGTVAASCLTARPDPGPPRTVPRPSPRLKNGSFRMSRLVVRPTTPTPRQPSPMFELPIALPQEFDLSVEVWGDLRVLGATRIAGRALRPLDVEPAPPSRAQWHAVRLRRDIYGLTLWVDQRRFPRSHDTETTHWLSVEPPVGEPGYFRNLHLVW